MKFLCEIFENIVINLYSYSVYVISGIFIYLIIFGLNIKLKFDARILKTIIILFALFLPICSCISITFLLHKKLVDDDRFILISYIFSTFFNITAFIYLYIFFGVFALLVYILIFLSIFVIIHYYFYIIKKENKNDFKTNIFSILIKKINNVELYLDNELHNKIDIKTNNRLYGNIDYIKKYSIKNIFDRNINNFRTKIINEIKSVSKFVFIHFIGLLIFSTFVVMFKSVQYINITNVNLPIFIFDNIFLKYNCIPYDITRMREYVYMGHKLSFIIPIFVISVILNIPELLLQVVIIKNKIIIYVATFFSSIFIGIISLFFENNCAFKNFSINYNDNLFAFANSLSINPNSFFRNASIIIYIILLIYFVSQKKES